ncbi:MAG: hypothetical protein KDA79_02795 [Planctomycetaceae bacterium]|nr:hypothetical protein [Planctomycetaceae bacterium]
MARRTGRGELEFGSDSFLDIVANIVGILIILIVVAGVRVGAAPVTREAVQAMLPAETAAAIPPVTLPEEKPAEPEPAAPGPFASPVVLDETPAPAPVVRPVLPPREPVAVAPPPARPLPSPALQEEIRQLEQEIDRLRQSASLQTAAVIETQQQAALASQTLERLNGQLATVQQQQKLSAQQVAMLQASLQQSRRQLEQLTIDLQEAGKPAPVAEIKHRLTPVSSEVEGHELHFRISGGKVSRAPIKPLLERLREQVSRQRSWLARTSRHHGQVGPLDGFVMDYIVERQPLTALEQLRSGGGSIRIGISRWELKPVPSLNSETVEQALGNKSTFLRILYSAEPNTALTFWVYPDSFNEFRQLQEFAHREGFRVAARPLPFGVPIAGSPSGSRSAGQ